MALSPLREQMSRKKLGPLEDERNFPQLPHLLTTRCRRFIVGGSLRVTFGTVFGLRRSGDGAAERGCRAMAPKCPGRLGRGSGTAARGVPRLSAGRRAPGTGPGPAGEEQRLGPGPGNL